MCLKTAEIELMDEFWKGLAENGAWALVAGFLLHTVIKAWAADRAQMVVLMTEFKDALYALKSAVEEMNRRLARE